MDLTSPSGHLDDEALSALLDGEAGAPADEEHVAGCTACAARRDELGAARAAVRNAPAPEIDELARRRLLAAALAAASDTASGVARPWYHRRAFAGGVAAALLALLAAVPFLSDDGGSDQSAAVADAGPTQLNAAAGTFLGDLGDVSDTAALRDRLGPATATARAGAPGAGSRSSVGAPEAHPAPAATEAVSSPGPSSAAPVTTTQTAQDTAKAPEGAGILDPAVADECVAILSAGPASGGSLIAVGVGTYRGIPAVVAAFSTAAGAEVFIASRDECRVLERAAL